MFKRFGERGMGEDGVAEGRVWQVAQHGYLDHRHDLTPFYTEHRAAQDPARPGVDDGFHETARLAHLYGPRNVRHRDLCHEHVEALVLASCSLSPIRPSCGSINMVYGTWRFVMVALPHLQEVGSDDAEVVVGDVGEGGPPLTSPSA